MAKKRGRRRKPGRPKGSKNKIRSGPWVGPMKRKRGRPKGAKGKNKALELKKKIIAFVVKA